MGGKRIEDYWSAEMKSVIDAFRQFEILIPSGTGGGSGHPAEDGRYVESILKDTLRKFLPAGVEVLTGFILRSGVKSGYSGMLRSKDEDRNSSQLDIIVYDSQNYPVYQRFGDTAVVLPEGVIGIISVKKTLRRKDLAHEIAMLRNAAKLCAFENRRGPFLALIGMDDEIGAKPATCLDKVFEAIKTEALSDKPVCYDDMPCFIGDLQKWTIHKTHRKDKKCAEFQLFVHNDGEEHLGIQYVLKGILDVYYCDDRGHGKQPGYISFPRGKGYDAVVKVGYEKERSVRR